MDRQEWLERVAQESAKFGHAVAEGLVKSAETLLGWLLVLLGGSTAYVLKAWEVGQLEAPTTLAAVGMAGGWAVVAVVLMVACISTQPLHGTWSDPEKLQKALERIEQDFEALRHHELEMMQDRIDMNRLRNQRIARWLDRCRYMALAVPVAAAVLGGWFS